MQERAKSFKRVFGTVLTNQPSQHSHTSLSKKDRPRGGTITREEASFNLYEYLKSRDRPKGDGEFFVDATITREMRRILVEWMVNVHHRFKLSQETLFIAVVYMDRVLSTKVPIKVQELQLVGAACLWMASKYQEVYSPPLKHFVEVTDNAYTKRDFLRMEETVLKLIDFNLTQPTRYEMLVNELKLLNISPGELLYDMCLYLCELSTLGIWNYREQEVTKGCVYLATRIFRKAGKTRIMAGSPDESVTSKNVAYTLSKYLGSNVVSLKYDCDAHQYVGGYVIHKKEYSP